MIWFNINSTSPSSSVFNPSTAFWKGAKAIETLAKEKGISVEEVRNEIQIAIDMGMANQDPDVQAYWRKIPYKGNKPTPEEVIAYIAKQVKKDIGSKQ